VGQPQAEAWLGEKLGEKLGESRAAIVKAMHADPKVTIKKLAALLNISTTAVEKNIEVLKARGYVQRVGSAKGGHWKLPGLAP
jgi:ATP-dependent DNA helicase RecG